MSALPTTATSTTTSSTAVAGGPAAPDAAARPGTSTALRVVGGGALIAGPVLFSLGMFTVPPQASMADTDYVTSLMRDATLTQVSALFLHYANIAIGLGLLAAPTLVRGRRGRWPAVIGALLGALGFLNVSGQILSDWWNMSAGRTVGAEKAVAIFEGVKGASLMPFWDATEAFSLLGPVLVFIGLARAGVVGWWTLPVFVGGVLALMFVPVQMIAVVALGVLVGFSPLAFVGLRLLQRARAGVA